MKASLGENDTETTQYDIRNTTKRGNNVDHSGDGRDDLFLAAAEAYDVTIVDRMAAGLDGLGGVKVGRVNERRSCSSRHCPVSTTHRGLEAGGDDDP